MHKLLWLRGIECLPIRLLSTFILVQQAKSLKMHTQKHIIIIILTIKSLKARRWPISDNFISLK